MHIALDPDDAAHLLIQAARGLGAGDTIQVEEGSTAILLDGGRPLRILPPGRYVVPETFAGPDRELYFVDTRSRAGVRFGGRVGPIQVPEGTVSSVFGELGFRVRSAEHLAVGMAGMGPGVESGEILTWVKDKVLRALEAALTAERTSDPVERVEAAIARVFSDATDLAEMGIVLETLHNVTVR